MYNAKAELCKISFYSKVPVIIQDYDINLIDYALNEGNMYELANTLLFNSNKEYKNMGLLKKKSKLFSFLYKKPKNTALKEKKTTIIEDGKVIEQGVEQKTQENNLMGSNNETQNNSGSVNNNV